MIKGNVNELKTTRVQQQNMSCYYRLSNGMIVLEWAEMRSVAHKPFQHIIVACHDLYGLDATTIQFHRHFAASLTFDDINYSVEIAIAQSLSK